MKSYAPVAICAIVFAAIMGGLFYKQYSAHKIQEQAAAKLAAMPVLRVFFIGNSYTFVNNMPLMVSRIAQSYKNNPVNLHVGMYTHGGWSLTELWNAQKGHDDPLFNQKWDIVVLQEISVETLQPEWRVNMQNAFISWNKLVRSLGAQPYIYETWARKPGSYLYTAYPDQFVSPEYMQQTVDYYTNMLAKYIHAPVVPVGDYFAYCRNLPGAPELYNPDTTHPSLAGDYLVSLLFARTFTHNRTEDATYVPPGLSPADAQFIVKCASYGEH